MSSDDLYRFDRSVTDQVTGLQKFDDGRWKNKRVSRKETWTFDGTYLVQTKTSRGRVKINTYDDLDGDGNFSPYSRDKITGARMGSSGVEDGYRFNLDSFGRVTSLQEFEDGQWKNERISRKESWAYDGTNLIQRKSEDRGVELTTFGDSDGDGVFTKISEVYSPSLSFASDTLF